MPITAVRTEKTVEEVVTRTFGRLAADELKAIVVATLAVEAIEQRGK